MTAVRNPPLPSSLSSQNEARKLNHAEVVEEDRRNKLPANWEARKRKAEWEANEEEARKVSSVVQPPQAKRRKKWSVLECIPLT